MTISRLTIMIFMLNSSACWADDDVLVDITPDSIPALSAFGSTGGKTIAVIKVSPDISSKFESGDRLSRLQVGSGIAPVNLGLQTALDDNAMAIIADKASSQLGVQPGVISGSNVEGVILMPLDLVGDGSNEWPGGQGGSIPPRRLGPPTPPPGGTPSSDTFMDFMQLKNAGAFDNGAAEFYAVSK
ncbi:hypothetical protein NKJ74_26955 [Mesorhizobium sp. M0046]|uniref:hypothetical protein n=1 Tax=Mesorhizobium sp. M0046 TaxID=2956858 RepID=UPI003336C056